MKRFLMKDLLKWKEAPRKPLVIRGARQVGKSYLVREFGKNYFEKYIEINFEKHKHLSNIFSSNDINAIIQSLEFEFDMSIEPGKILLFFDEIQAFPLLLPKLRYFYEEYPDLHIITAGSLLDFLLEEHEFSMPVGRIEYMYMGPMSFQEFLHASSNSKLADYLDCFQTKDQISCSIHEKLVALFRKYIYLGGMPEVINTYLTSQSFRDAERIKQSIINTYQDDFVKYKKHVNYQLLVKIFARLPLNVAKKIKYVNILRDERAKKIADAMHLFSMARVVSLIRHTAANGVPLGAEARNDVFKLLFLDVGLMLSMCGLTYNDIELKNNNQLINAGDLCEQLVGQHLLYSKDYFYEPELFYWQREHANSSAEIDYVISEGAFVIPIEVKAGKSGQLKSLHQFIKAKNTPLAVRLNLDAPSCFNANNKLSDGALISYKLLSIPIYMIEQLRRLIREEIA